MTYVSLTTAAGKDTPATIDLLAHDSDGTFPTMFALPEAADLGPHTIRVDGLSVEGESVSTNVGTDIVEAPVEPSTEVDEEPPTTGADLRPAGAAALLLLVGLGLAFVGRRRHLSAVADQGEFP